MKGKLRNCFQHYVGHFNMRHLFQLLSWYLMILVKWLQPIKIWISVIVPDIQGSHVGLNKWQVADLKSSLGGHLGNMPYYDINFTSIHVMVYMNPDSKVHGANMGPTWVLSDPDGPHVGPMNLAIREMSRYYYRAFVNYRMIAILRVPTV